MVGPDRILALLTGADATRHGNLVRLAVMTGLRQGELLGLRWQDVNLDAGMIHVQQVAQWLPGQGTTFREPKTPKSRRAVAIAPDTVRVLREHRAKQLEERILAGPAYDDHGLVFATPIGNAIDPSNLRRAWSIIVKGAGIARLRFHDLRHAHASLMLAQGTHVKIVSERLGHSGVGITLDLYSHVLPGLQAQAAADLETLLSEAKTKAV